MSRIGLKHPKTPDISSISKLLFGLAHEGATASTQLSCHDEKEPG